MHIGGQPQQSSVAATHKSVIASSHRLTRPTRDLMKVRDGAPHAYLVMAGLVPAIYPKLIG
jgi:hypothetical protein